MNRRTRTALGIISIALALTCPAKAIADGWRGTFLCAAGVLNRGDWLSSKDGNYVLLFDDHGELLFYQVNGPVLWRAETGGKGATFVRLEGNGVLVIYASPNTAVGTVGNGLTYYTDGATCNPHLEVLNTAKIMVFYEPRLWQKP